MSNPPVVPQKRKLRAVAFIENIIFNVRWVLILFYLGLVVVLFMYGFSFAKEVLESIRHSATASTEELKTNVLDMVDIVMIANLVKMIITGSYNSFISKDHGRNNENISSGMLKIKISTSVIIVCMINMLRSFVLNNQTFDQTVHQLMVFGAFLSAALILGIMEYLHIKGEVLENHHH